MTQTAKCAFCLRQTSDLYYFGGQRCECRDCHEKRIARETREGIDTGDDLPAVLPRSRVLLRW